MDIGSTMCLKVSSNQARQLGDKPASCDIDRDCKSACEGTKALCENGVCVCEGSFSETISRL